MDPASDAASFISRWSRSGAAERANYQLFLSELCDILHVERPDPSVPDDMYGDESGAEFATPFFKRLLQDLNMAQ